MFVVLDDVDIEVFTRNHARHIHAAGIVSKRYRHIIHTLPVEFQRKGAFAVFVAGRVKVIIVAIAISVDVNFEHDVSLRQFRQILADNHVREHDFQTRSLGFGEDMRRRNYSEQHNERQQRSDNLVRFFHNNIPFFSAGRRRRAAFVDILTDLR